MVASTSAPRRVGGGDDDGQRALAPLLLVLTVVTGLVDAVSYLALGHVFVANMTGNVVFLGFAVAGAQDFSVPASLLAIAAFLAGALAGGRIGSGMAGHRTRFFTIAILVNLGLVGSAVVAASVMVDPTGGAGRHGLVVVLAFAMGLQNAAARVLAVADLATNVLTSTLTALAADAASAGGAGPQRTRRLLATGAMLLGAAVGAFVVLRVGVGAALALTFVLLSSNAIAACRVWRRSEALT